MQVPLFHVDAFTHIAFSGNPAAVCCLNSWLDDTSLRKVAAENNLSATAFLVGENDTYELRWFTPRCEIRLCGHATLASAHVLFHILKPGLTNVRFLTRFSGELMVRQENNRISMVFPALLPQRREEAPDGLITALGLEKPPLELWEVNNILIAVLGTSREVRDIRPDFALLEQLHPNAVTATAPGENSDFVSRYFAPSYGVPEDSVTGSAHCALAPYWAKRLNQPHMHARQLSDRGGELWCEVSGDRVLLTGEAVLVMKGNLSI